MNTPLPYTVPGYYRLSACAFYFIQGLVFASWASRIPDIKQALHLNDAALGSLLFIIPLGQMTAMAFSGYAVGKYGSRKMVTLAAILYPGTLVLLGLARNVTELTAALFLFGMAANLSNISINTQGVGVERLYKRSIMARFHGLWSLAGFIGGLISTWMVSCHLKPLEHFCFIFAFCIVLLLAMHPFMLPRDPKTNGATTPNGKKKIFTKPDKYVFLLGVIAFGSMVSEGTMFDWSGVYFESVINPGPDLVRLGYIAFMCTMAIGRFTADRLIIRFGVIPILQISGVTIAAGLILSVLYPHIIVSSLGFALVGFGTSSIIPMCYSLAGRSKAMIPSVAIATVSSIGFLGFLIGPPIIGFIAHASSLRWSFVLIAVIGFMTTLIAPKLRKF